MTSPPRSTRPLATLAAVLGLGLLSPLLDAPTPRPPTPDPSTPEDRAALFEYILRKTMEREAFSPIKNATLGLDVEREMRRYRDEMIAADTDEKLYYALLKISNARRDRHLRISLVPGGLAPDHTDGLDLSGYPTPADTEAHAPIRFAVDYGLPDRHRFFVADLATDSAQFGGGPIPAVGDVLTAINGQPIDEYVEATRPYRRYSTINGLWLYTARALPRRTFQLPPSMYGETVRFRLSRSSGESYDVTLPYLHPSEIRWRGIGAPTYPGFIPVMDTPTFDVYQHRMHPIILLQWHGFREYLVRDVDRLMVWAQQEGYLDHALIFDGTRSRGGSLGPYAIQHFSRRSFTTTFGNLRISDATAAFAETRIGRWMRDGLDPDAVPGVIDDGTWLVDWLNTDVVTATRDGRAYTNNVPFKLAHAPRHSDGVLQSADVHFRGPLVVLMGPYGGSHLDQFMSIVVDNGLGYTIGMPAGGYSNTWEWEEVLHFPLSGKPVVRWMWSIGHTIRPNGEILEGNPAAVDEYVPVTRDNYREYYPRLISRALHRLGY